MAPFCCRARAAGGDLVSFGDDPSELTEPSDTLLGGGYLVAVPRLCSGSSEVRADLVDGHGTASPPFLIGVADQVALVLVLAHTERVREDRGAAHVQDRNHPELVLAAHLRVADVADLLVVNRVGLALLGLARGARLVEEIAVVGLGERDGCRRPGPGGGQLTSGRRWDGELRDDGADEGVLESKLVGSRGGLLPRLDEVLGHGHLDCPRENWRRSDLVCRV